MGASNEKALGIIFEIFRQIYNIIKKHLGLFFLISCLWLPLWLMAFACFDWYAWDKPTNLPRILWQCFIVALILLKVSIELGVAIYYIVKLVKQIKW
jgi:hypothetical protein